MAYNRNTNVTTDIDNTTAATANTTKGQAVRRHCDQFLNLSKRFGTVFNTTTNEPMLLGLPTNNTDIKDPTKSLGLGITFLEEGCKALAPTTTPKEGQVLSQMRACAPRIATQIKKEIAEVTKDLNPGDRTIAYSLCRPTQLYVQSQDGTMIPLGEVFTKSIDKEGKEVYVAVEATYQPTPADLVLEVNVPRTTEPEPEKVKTPNPFMDELPF